MQRRLTVLIHRRLARSELEDVRAYARLTTSLLASEVDKHRSHVDSVIAGMTPEETEAYIDNNYDAIEQLQRQFPNRQKQSLVVLAYSVVESRLLAVARSIIRDSGTGLTLKDLAGDSPYQKSRKCASKLGGISIDEGLWNAVDGFRLVRNAIVHNAGSFNDDPQPPVKQLLKKTSSIRLADDGEILLDERFLDEFLVAVEALYEALFTRWAASAA